MPKSEGYTLVFGLTADPIHKGHEQVIVNSFNYAQTHGLEIKEFILVPTYQPNLIADKKQPQTAYKHRYSMCKLVAKEITNMFNFNVYVSDIEKELFLLNQTKNYSYDTLKALPGQKKLFVLSADHFAGRWPKFRKWHQWQNLICENGLLIHQRPGHGINNSFIQQLKIMNPDTYVVKDLPSVNVSSTILRELFYSNRKPDGKLISKQVVDYINDRGIYHD